MAAAPPSPPKPPGLSSLSLEYAPLPMATVEGATHIVHYVNPAFCLLMKQSAEQLVGRPLSELLPEKDKCMTLIDQVFRTGKPVSHIEKDPSEPVPVFWSYTMWPLMEEELRIGVMIQVTESAKAHESTVEMNEALLLGSLRQHELAEAAESLNEHLRAEIAARAAAAKELAEKARLLDLTHDAIIVRNLYGLITYWNRGAEEIYGWSSEEAIGKVSELLFNTEYTVPIEEITKELHRTGRWTGELVHTRSDGRKITVLVRKTLDRDSEGNPASVLLNITDITERKAVEAALREAGERFRFMAESMPQKIFTANPDGGLDYLNGQWSDYTGLTFEEMRDWGWTRFVHADDLEESVSRWKHSIKTGVDFELENRFYCQDGNYRWHLNRAYAMRDAKGDVVMWIGSSTDIDNMMQAQEELLEAEAQLADHAAHLDGLVFERTVELTAANLQLLEEAEKRKHLEAEVAGAIEGERERLGQELHDGVVQELTGIAMMMHALAKTLKKSAPTQAKEADRLCLLMESAHGHARDLAKSFYPVELEQHGLVVALEGIAQRTAAQFGISCEVIADSLDSLDSLDSTGVKDVTSVQLFRIAQEAVQNAAKHAQARNILIYLSRKKSEWHLTVRGDGIGMPSNSLESAGMGLRIMSYRAGILNGTISVSNAEGGGVIVCCTAPVLDHVASLK